MEAEIKLNLEEKNTNNIIEEDISFNRLKDLQKLLKKESAIKELFIRMKDETKKGIESQCLEVLRKKIEVLDILQKISNQNPINNNKSAKDSKNSPQYLKEYILVENNYEFFSDLNRYIANILKYLWEEPKLLADILIGADKQDVKTYLAPFICNNFYQNILYANFIEDPLIYIIYILLKKEIDSIEKIEDSDNFLENTQCGFLLEQLIEHNDVKEFFKIILESTMEDLGTNKFMFDLDDLNIWQKQNKRTVSKSVYDKNYLKDQNVDKTGRRKTLDQINTDDSKVDISKMKTLTKVDIAGISNEDKDNIKNNINYMVFSSRYLITITLKQLEDYIKNNENNAWMKSYYEYLLLNAKGNKDAYSQNNFIDKMSDMDDSESILVFYQENFLKVMEFITKLFDNLKSNYRIIPHAIKCVCKIIFQLVSNKFPNASLIEKSLFISRFFFKTLLSSIFQKPDINALINNYIISNNTLFNLKIISDILIFFSTFHLFKDKEENNSLKGDFTPFNQFFVEKTPEIIDIYKSLIDVNLPKFIDGLIDKSINEEEYCFEFFNENPNQISFYQNILFNLQEFNTLYMNILKFKKQLLDDAVDNNNQSQIKTSDNESKYAELKKRQLVNKKNIKKAVEKIKLQDNFELLTKLVNQVDYSITKTEVKSEGFFSRKKTIIDKKEKVRYFHYSQLLFNEKSNKIFSLEQKKFYYHIKEIKEKERKTKELIDKNNIIKCKNFISSILYNYRILNKSDFSKGSTNGIINILNELKYFMKSTNFLIDGTIPFEWYILSLIEYLKKLPEDYKKNDYEKLFSELTDELNESIKICNFEYMSLFLDGMKFGNRNKLFFEKVKQIYIDIELNNKANSIIEKDEIDVTLYYNLSNTNKQEFSIYQKGIKEKQLDFLDSFTFDTKFMGYLCKTINQFIKKFPNLNKYVETNENDEKIKIFEFQEKLNVNNQINSFFNIITAHLKSKIKNENELNIINNKIYDYVMSSIHQKIYPKCHNTQDEELLEKTCKLNWLEPENAIKGESRYDFDFVLPDIDNYFKLIRAEKSPRKKIINLNNIFLAINRLIKFNKGDVAIGVDDQMPLLVYCFIKAKPWKIFTDSYFMKLYIGTKKNKSEDNELTQLLSICDIIKDAKYNTFQNVNEDDFNQKCSNSFKELDEYIRTFLNSS